MSENDKRRSIILRRVSQRTLTLCQAATILSLSSRHVKRIWKRFRLEGEQGLAHRSIGRPSNRAFSEGFKKEILERYQERAQDLTPSSFSAELAARGIAIDHETLRRWLLGGELWKRRRTCRMTPQNRCADHGFGEELTLLSVPSTWIDAHFPATCLLRIRDEATALHMWSIAEEELSAAAMRLLWLWIDRHGIPAALRCQRRFILNDNRHPTLEEQLEGIEQRTHFARSCDRLGIDLEVMLPAKARRALNEARVLTEHLECELSRLPDLSFEGVTAVLRGTIGDGVDSPCAARAVAAADYHVPIVDGTDLRSIFCSQREQNVGPDLVIQHHHRRFRLATEFQNIGAPIRKVVVSEWLDGSLHFLLNGTELNFDEIRAASHRSDKLAI